MVQYRSWFSRITGFAQGPHDWQAELALADVCTNRLIRILTGLGKTEGVLGAWLWYAVHQQRHDWPRRLVWCLPMRVLVEQTAGRAQTLIDRWAESIGRSQRPKVHVLMGGEETEPWHLEPTAPAVLVGTQDMLLSRALNRGYASGRARWPMEYALLNQDCLWVMDEVQLMDVGLITSVQLEAFRDQDQAKQLRPCWTWWMSATLQPDWLDTVDFRAELQRLKPNAIRIPPAARTGPLWEIRKPLSVVSIPAKEKDAVRRDNWTNLILDAHRQAAAEETVRVTLVIVNRVEAAQEIHAALQKQIGNAGDDRPHVELIHSRFRGLERGAWADRFLSRAICENPATNLILVSTQVVEAGVDISATALVTELAPWPSLVQRFGRAARYGGTAKITVVDPQPDEKTALPYALSDLNATRDALHRLEDVGLKSLEEFEADLMANTPEQIAQLYRYEYVHLLTRQEFDELFDTSPDLSGADVDIGRFIRSGDERDVHVCWIAMDGDEKAQQEPPPDLQPLRDGLCPVPIYRAHKWLFDKGRLKEGCNAWGWNYVEGQWQRLRSQMCYPGQVVLVEAAWGGYDVARGFTGERPKRTDLSVPTEGGYTTRASAERADGGQPRDDRSRNSHWKTIATHGHEVAGLAVQLAREIGLDESLLRVLEMAGLVHDWGKAHAAFEYNIVLRDGDPVRDDLAKAPQANWVDWRAPYYACPEKNRPTAAHYGRRQGFRHELASAAALFELLARADPYHEALLGPHVPLVELGVLTPPQAPTPLAENPWVDLLRELTAVDFNLLAYLVCCHHGKVRGTWQATPHDQDFPVHGKDLVGRGLPIRGLRDGDPFPGIELSLSDGRSGTVPSLELHLDLAAAGLSSRYGAAWTDRVLSLIERFGPTTLAYLETLLRVADARGSELQTEDHRIVQEKVT